MSTEDRRWRAALLTLCAIGAVLFVMSVHSGSLTASEGLDFRIDPTGTPFLGRVGGVANDSPASSAGLRNGDVVAFGKLGPDERYRLLSGVYGHQSLSLVVLRNGVPHRISYTSGPAVPVVRWDLILSQISIVWELLFAALLAWRRPGLPEARTLSIFLAVNWFAGDFAPGNWASASLWFDLLLAAVSFAIQGVSTALLAYYAGLFARPLSPLRRAFATLSYATAALGALGSSYVLLADTYGSRDPFSGTGSWSLLVAASWAFPLLAMVAAIAVSRGAERSRVAWTTLSLAPLILPSIPYAYASGILSTSNAGYSIFTQLTNFGFFLGPIGITYALLNRRLLDLGFAINRAAVYTGVSVVVVGTFVLVEFILGEWLGAGRNANLIAGAVLALLLGFSMRYIHARVDHVLDNVFFKKRHDDEHSIRQFAHEIVYITDAAVILERMRQQLETRADAAWVDIELADASGNYGDVDENDRAIVTMRASHRPVDLHGVESALRGEFAYPMVARGRLTGVLVLGPKRSGEAYAPDESDAIAQLAHGAALALDTLAVKSGEQSTVIEAIRASNERVIDAIRDLKQSLTSPIR